MMIFKRKNKAKLTPLVALCGGAGSDSYQIASDDAQKHKAKNACFYKEVA